MSAPALLAGLAAGVGVATLVGSPRHVWRRLAPRGASASSAGTSGRRRVSGAGPPGPRRSADPVPAPAPSAGRDPTARRRLALAGLAVAVGVLFGSLPLSGALLALAVVADRLLARLEPASVRARKEQIVAGLPTFADLVAATVRAGVPPERAMGICARVVGGPIGAEIDAAVSALELGMGPSRVWAQAGAVPGLEPLARAMARGSGRGSSPVVALERCALDARRIARAAARRRAQSVAVAAAAPLGLCFLPAFVLVSVVPTVVGGISGLLG